MQILSLVFERITCYNLLWDFVLSFSSSLCKPLITPSWWLYFVSKSVKDLVTVCRVDSKCANRLPITSGSFKRSRLEDFLSILSFPFTNNIPKTRIKNFNIFNRSCMRLRSLSDNVCKERKDEIWTKWTYYVITVRKSDHVLTIIDKHFKQMRK